MFNKHSAFCTFTTILQLIFSPSLCQAKSWVKLSLDSQATFQSPVWIPIGCSWFLVWLLLRVLEKVAQPTSMGQRWRVCPQSHLEQDLVWCDSVGICQKTEGGVFHVQLGREGSPLQLSALQCFPQALWGRDGAGQGGSTLEQEL